MDKHTKVMLDLELLYDKWLREWAKMVRDDTQPSRETVREFVLELKTVYVNNVDYSKVEDLIDYACSE